MGEVRCLENHNYCCPKWKLHSVIARHNLDPMNATHSVDPDGEGPEKESATNTVFPMKPRL